MGVKILVAGPRWFDDYLLFKSKMGFYLQNIQGDIEIVHGCCQVTDQTGMLTYIGKDGTKIYGADGFAEQYADEMGYRVTRFPADWKGLGKKAAYIRNRSMAVYVTGDKDRAVIFWDEISKGTKMMMNLCDQFSVKYRLVKYQPKEGKK